jgi:hypothetical protein
MITADTVSSIQKGFKAIAQEHLSLEGESADVIIDSTKRWLTNHRLPWLLIFDNADHIDIEIGRYFPISNHGSILITSRDSRFKRY